MADNHTHGGMGSSWGGLAATFILGIISKITLSDVALIATILAALSTFGLNIYKWIKNKS
jgi:hypothetical protein